MVTVRPSDKDAKARYNECDKVVKRIAFERAIASDETKSIAEQVNIEAMSIEDEYSGPKLEDGQVTETFVKELMTTFKEQKSLHKKYAYKVCALSNGFRLKFLIIHRTIILDKGRRYQEVQYGKKKT